MPLKPYGYELILDLHSCDLSRFERKFLWFRITRRRQFLRAYFKRLCEAIHMTRCKLVFWDDKYVLPWRRQTSPHTKGTSAVQFIVTSSITVHYLDLLKSGHVNIFSCKPFKPKIAEDLTKAWFGTKECTARFIERT